MRAFVTRALVAILILVRCTTTGLAFCSTPTSLVSGGWFAGQNGGTGQAYNATGCDLIVLIQSSYTTTAVTRSDTQNTWTCDTMRTTTNPSGGLNSEQMCWVQAPFQGSATLTLNGTSTYPSGLIFCIPNALTPTSYDDATGTTVNTGGVATINPGTVSPVNDNEVIISGFVAGTSLATDMVINAGSMTKLDSRGYTSGQTIGVAGAYWIQTTSTTTTSEQWKTNEASQGTIGLTASIAAFKCVVGSVSTLPLAGAGR